MELLDLVHNIISVDGHNYIEIAPQIENRITILND